MEQPKNDVLKVKRLHVEFQTSHGMVHAVKDVSLEVKRGRIHALVGESGSGKSVTSLTIMNLLAGNGKVISGDVTLNEKSLLKLSGKEKRQFFNRRPKFIVYKKDTVGNGFFIANSNRTVLFLQIIV